MHEPQGGWSLYYSVPERAVLEHRMDTITGEIISERPSCHMATSANLGALEWWFEKYLEEDKIREAKERRRAETRDPGPRPGGIRETALQKINK
jgi:hypothetical protein